MLKATEGRGDKYMPKVYKGEVKARIVELRFAASGKISAVSKHAGDIVKKGNLIASLDRKLLQAQLDKQLADYDKMRADFDSFAAKYPDPQDDNKYKKAEKQAMLNSSVKDVEVSKALLDRCDLFSPVNGIVIDDSGIVAGIYATPASASVKVIDTDSYYFEIEVPQKDLTSFTEGRGCKITIEGVKDKIEADSSPVFSDGKKFLVRVNIPAENAVMVGMKGEASINK